MAGDKIKKNDNGNGLLLYQYYSCYFSQKVVFALYEKKIKFKSRVIDIRSGEQFEPWFLKLNPRCEVPVLKDGVKIIPDSKRIIDYLEDNFSNGDTPRLIPKKGTLQYQTMERMRDLLDNIPIPLVTFGCLVHPELTGEIQMPAQEVKVLRAIFYSKLNILNDFVEKYKEYKDHFLVKKTSFEKLQAAVADTNEVEKGLLDIEYALKETEKLVASQENDGSSKSWLCGDKFTIADISLCVLLNHLRLLGLLDKLFKDDNLKYLQDYFKRAQQRDAYKRTMNQGSSILKSFSSMNTKDQVLVTVGGIAVIVGAIGVATFLIQRNK